MTSPLTKPLAVVFDNDGLLLDTEPCWTVAEEALFRAYGRVFDLDAKRALVGTSPKTSAPILERLLDQPGAGQALSDELYALAVTEIGNGATPRPGAIELVAALRSAGLPLAVASNSPRSHLLAGLRRVGMQDQFDVVLGVDDVVNPKPAPDLYVQACRGLEVDPADAIALEDSLPGVGAAKAAGMRVIGIPSVAGVVLDGHADLVAGSLADAAVHRALGLDA
ncbi:MAG TPA: HAD family phosphatase [Streptosporangiaceae bacterium]|nr:HAD family phosphatase [Streptosporangiaceae bacterium]